MSDITLDELLDTARELIGDDPDVNSEYVRALAEMIVDITPGLNQNSHRDAILALFDLRAS